MSSPEVGVSGLLAGLNARRVSASRVLQRGAAASAAGARRGCR